MDHPSTQNQVSIVDYVIDDKLQNDQHRLMLKPLAHQYWGRFIMQLDKRTSHKINCTKENGRQNNQLLNRYLGQFTCLQ